MLYHPKWFRSCESCAKYWYIEGDGPDAGTIRRERGTRELMLRPNPESTPCRDCKKIPDTAPTKNRIHAIEMSDASRRMLDFYHECKATGTFAGDEIVRWYAGIISQIEGRFELNSVCGRLDGIRLMLGVSRG